MLTSALQLFGNFLSSEIGQLHTERNMMAQHQMNKEIMDYQHNQNIQNMLNSGIYERRSRENAGLNVNNGAPFTPVGTSAVGSSAPSGAPMSPVDFANFLVASEQAKNIHEDTKRKELDNKATEEENAWYKWAFDPRFDDLQYSKDVDGYILPNSKIIVPRTTTRKGVESRQLAKARIEQELASANRSISQDELHEMISSKQIQNNEVLDALVSLPLTQYNEVMKKIDEMTSHISLMDKQGDLFVSQKELNNLEKEFSPKAIMEKILDKPFDLSTWFATIVSLAVKRAFGK